MLLRRMKERKGFGIVEVLISAAVLGFLYLALLNLQLGNRESLIRIRGRDGAVEVAQQVLDSLQAIGARRIISKPSSDTTYNGLDYERTWDRGPGGKSSVVYKTQITVKPHQEYATKEGTELDTIVHVHAKNVVVKVSWPFKGSTQSIDISGVIR